MRCFLIRTVCNIPHLHYSPVTWPGDVSCWDQVELGGGGGASWPRSSHECLEPTGRRSGRSWPASLGGGSSAPGAEAEKTAAAATWRVPVQGSAAVSQRRRCASTACSGECSTLQISGWGGHGSQHARWGCGTNDCGVVVFHPFMTSDPGSSPSGTFSGTPFLHRGPPARDPPTPLHEAPPPPLQRHHRLVRPLPAGASVKALDRVWDALNMANIWLGSRVRDLLDCLWLCRK